MTPASSSKKKKKLKVEKIKTKDIRKLFEDMNKEGKLKVNTMEKSSNKGKVQKIVEGLELMKSDEFKTLPSIHKQS